ncbi:isopenicillin N synthase family oxygenase [Pelagibius sp. Alg239-R121]|uniref:isopenicillin N synthase family dioxygenase n=1 Tax=Pelagibius sp. Alg239-R121 TaxID=2993448 RepID=UPI0024A765E2|nr:2-oxoglutarate and iron-dependent oxygenase domain-containing protein [Pelagibius sp. Alg239-R121]
MFNSAKDQKGSALPIIDMAPLFGDSDQERAEVAGTIQTACRDSGFFYVTGHGIAQRTLDELDVASRRFFALPTKRKMAIAMSEGGLAWRGFFPVGGELTSGQPDIKEGLYFGSELASDHPRVKAGFPLHGANLWPDEVPELRKTVTDYMEATTRAGAALLEGVALSLNLEPSYFAAHYTAQPTVLFRIFHYPAPPAERVNSSWGVGEHTDYGLLTLLAQDRHGGLQVKTPHGWIDAPPIRGTLVCNIGDMLDRLTGGWFRSTPHRVRNVSGEDRLSFPLFFDPDFVAEMQPLPQQAARPAEQDVARWDGADLQAFKGTYGDYLIGKVSKVFPELGEKVL